MKPISFGLLETTHIANGYYLLNEILQSHSVDVVLAKNICPGRLLIILKGCLSEIKQALYRVQSLNPETGLKTELVSGVSEDVFEILKKRTFKKPEPGKAIAIFEFKRAIDSIKGADIALKNSSSVLYKIDYNLGLFGKGVVTLSGSLSDMETARHSIENTLNDTGCLICSKIIANPVAAFLKLL